MAADFNKPVLADAYASVLQSVRDLAKDLALMLDNTGTQNIPTGAIKWNSTNARFEKYNGSAWAAMVSRMTQDVTSVMGYAPGNGSGALAVNNGTLNTNLNAEMVGGSTLAKIFQADYLASQSLSDANNGAVRGASAHYIAGTNKPAGTEHGLLTLAYSAAWAVQMAGDWRTNDWYVRNENNGTWGGWQKLYHTGNFTPNATAQNNIGAPGTYGGINILGSNGSWAGFQFNSSARYFMSTSGQTGEYDTSAGWQWRWDSGTLSAGTVPWARLSGVPSFNYLPSTGGNSGYIAVANEGATQDPYGAISVTKPAVSDTPSYFSMTRAGNGVVQMGMDSGNRFVMGSGTSGAAGRITSSWMIVNGHIWAANYGWLHDYFTRTVNAGNGLTGGGSGPNITISHPNTIAAGSTSSFTSWTGLSWNANGHLTSANCNCNCNCRC